MQKLSKHKVSFIILKIVAGRISDITPIILQNLGVGLYSKLHGVSRLVLVSLK